ncbi:class I SAM-dependent methyltransferase [Methylacidiphilum caldifontis]|uniref:class I SAM-dependent methyltransferase n=1 Tax=Methylacidiphilum caldifontis TaxID=2795386 RepID=UPI001A8E6E92|nr:class I SAM-dependent methyltransferase [Methylacidiphilum caldifontis]QSR88130.1 class I SAM-dependent methyltransferase [Methylacidiphilum caldifontis]
MENSVSNNKRVWDKEYSWPEDGEEWNGQAKVCGVPYELWKQSIIDTFFLPHITNNSVVLEIAPGHGRWTCHLSKLCKKLVVVDLSPNCIEYCKRRFSGCNNILYYVNDGLSLGMLEDQSIDFIWSFDAFVHMDASVIQSYFYEFKRVLKKNAKAIIHHGGRNHLSLFLGFLKDLHPNTRKLYRWISMGYSNDDDGWRSVVSKELVLKMAKKARLTVEKQIQRWGKGNIFGVPRYNDWITILLQ